VPACAAGKVNAGATRLASFENIVVEGMVVDLLAPPPMHVCTSWRLSPQMPATTAILLGKFGLALQGRASPGDIRMGP